MKWKRPGDYATSCKGSIAIDDADKKGRIELKLLDLHERIKKKPQALHVNTSAGNSARWLCCWSEELQNWAPTTTNNKKKIQITNEKLVL